MILGTALKGAKSQVNLVGAPSFAQVNPYGLYNHFKSDEYASHYPNVRPITNEFMQIVPYAIDANGKPTKHAVIDALYHPNRRDSLPMFLEKLGVSVLSNSYTYLLVWRRENNKAQPGGEFGYKGKNVAGFTFLENPAVDYRDGKIYYKMGAQQFSEDDVIAIPGGSRPDDLYGGYSPALSAAKWATLDGYIADFQNGFFQNNAIPAGVFKVAASTPTEYKDMVEQLKDRHQGAGNNNNVSYTHVPIDAQGKLAPAQIEYVPFAQSNKEIDFEPLLKHVDDRLSESYGVSSIIKGVDSSAKYSNAEVSEAGFAKRAVKPLPLRIYSQITHELNRITGGLGVAITFKYDIPAVSDAEYVKAQTKEVEANIILKYTSDPYNWSLDSVIDAFQLSQSYKLLKQGTGKTVIDNDKPEVDEGNEVDQSPDPTLIDGVTPVNKLKEGGIVEKTDVLVTGEATSTNPKAKLTNEEKLYKSAKKYMKSQVDRSTSEYKADVSDEVKPEPTEDELVTFIDDMMVTITAILITNGEIGYAEVTRLMVAYGISTDLLTEFNLTDTIKDGYKMYLRKVGNSYGSDTAQIIRETLAMAKDEGLSNAETIKNLRAIMDTSEYRIKRLAVTELNRSQDIGNIESVRLAEAQTGVHFEKSLFHPNGAQCEFCKALEGVWTSVNEPLLSIGQSVVGVDGGILVNDFATNEGYDPHPNGNGVPIYRVVS